MFNIALALVLPGDDDGQTVFLAKPIRSAADIMITPLVGMIVLVIRKTDRIDARTIATMLMSDVDLKSYTDISYHNEELKFLKISMCLTKNC